MGGRQRNQGWSVFGRPMVTFPQRSRIGRQPQTMAARQAHAAGQVAVLTSQGVSGQSCTRASLMK